MVKTIGMIELNSIARGIETADTMLKAGEVELLLAKTVCPGKYLILITGNVGAVKSSVETGTELGGEYVVDTLVIPNVHPQVIPAISATNAFDGLKALGILEYFSIATAIVGADQAVKSADVQLIEIRLGIGIGGKAFVTLTGDVSAVKNAVEVGSNIGRENGMLVNKAVIPFPKKELLESLV